MKKSFVHTSILVALTALGVASGCSHEDTGAATASVSAGPNASITPLTDAALSRYEFAASTPTGRALFKYSVPWKDLQLTSAFKPFYPQAAMCATNLTEVYEEVFGGKYQSDNVPGFRDQLTGAGANITWFLGDSNASIVKKLNSFHAKLSGGTIKGTGYLPLGTVLGGCKASTGRNCDGVSSDGHIGMIGNIRTYPIAGSSNVHVVYYFWNNNWLRNRAGVDVDRDMGFDLGKLRDYFLPSNFASLGYERHWMGVPVLDVTYDAAGRALAVNRLAPELDDVDLGSDEYETFLAVPQEIRAELAADNGVRLMSSAAPVPAKPGTAAVKTRTFIKKRPVQSSDLASNEKCEVTNLATVLAYKGRLQAENGHWKVDLAFADASCPTMTGTVYLFGDHWAFTDK